MAKKVDVAKGAYVVSDDEEVSLILIATGSEVGLALKVADMFRAQEIGVRVVSMPSQELFLQQSKEYQDSVLPPECDLRVSIEAASTFGWHKFVGSEGLAIGLDTFGASAPYKVLAEEFGFTPEKVAQKIVEHFAGDSCGCDCGSCGGCH